MQITEQCGSRWGKQKNLLLRHPSSANLISVRIHPCCLQFDADLLMTTQFCSFDRFLQLPSQTGLSFEIYVDCCLCTREASQQLLITFDLILPYLCLGLIYLLEDWQDNAEGPEYQLTWAYSPQWPKRCSVAWCAFIWRARICSCSASVSEERYMTHHYSPFLRNKTLASCGKFFIAVCWRQLFRLASAQI